MFFIAIVRPRITQEGEVLWDVKIEVFQFTKTHIAIRCSENRLTRTLKIRNNKSDKGRYKRKAY